MSLIYERVFKDAREDVWKERKPEQILISLWRFRFNSQLFGLPYLELPTISKAMGCGALLVLKELVLGFFSPNTNNCSSQQSVKVQNVEKKPKDSDTEKGVRHVMCQRCQRWADCAAGGADTFELLVLASVSGVPWHYQVE